jgi:hypothetical protein
MRRPYSIGAGRLGSFRSIGRPRQFSLVLGIGLALLAIGVVSGRVIAIPVAIWTGTEWAESSGMVGCYLSNIRGELVTDPVAGTAIIETRSGPGATTRRYPVTWPPGWTGRRSFADIEIVDSLGHVNARTGTRVFLLGGHWYKNDSFLTCGNVPDPYPNP